MRSLILIFAILLAACTAPVPTAAPATSTASSDATQSPSGTSAPLDTPAPTAVPATATATAAPPSVAYLAAGGGTPGAREAVERAAAEFGWILETPAGESEAELRAAAQAGPRAIVADGAAMQVAVRTLAAEFPQIYFVGVDQAGEAAEMPNLLTLGGPESRHDQLGFTAGALAGLMTNTRIVTAIADTASAAGLKYRNGFLHGVRYTCTRCRVDFIDLADLNATEFAAERARLNASLSSDVVFAAAGPAGVSGLRAAAQQGAWVIGAGGAFDAGTGAARLVTRVYFDAGELVYQALSGLSAGSPTSGARPFDAAAGAIGLAPYNDSVTDAALSDLDRQDVAAALARLASGALDTGIDPLTGQVR